MKGTVIFEDRTAPLEDLLVTHGAGFTPPPAARLQIDCGEVAFIVGSTARPPEVPRPALARLEDHWPWLVAGLGALLMMLLVSFLPPDMMSLSGELDPNLRKSIPITVIPPMPPPTPLAARTAAAGAPRAGGGSAGSTTRHPTPVRKTPRSRATAAEEVRQRGVLGVLLAYQGNSLTQLFSNDDRLQPGPIAGLVDGSGTGPGGYGIGLGVTGSGFGPNSGPLNGIGPDRLGTGCDADCRAGELKASRLRQHQALGPQVEIGSVHTQGGLTKDIVRRIIRQHLNEVKYCYELQLPRHPELAGRITVQFTIAAEGNVTASLMQTSSLNNVAVESCIVQATRRWEFPRRTAGLTIVSYPFVLVPAGS
jgi:hypothetical protein